MAFIGIYCRKAVPILTCGRCLDPLAICSRQMGFYLPSCHLVKRQCNSVYFTQLPQDSCISVCCQSQYNLYWCTPFKLHQSKHFFLGLRCHLHTREVEIQKVKWAHVFKCLILHLGVHFEELKYESFSHSFLVCSCSQKVISIWFQSAIYNFSLPKNKVNN